MGKHLTLVLCGVLFLIGCSGGSSSNQQSPPQAPPPSGGSSGAPVISSLSPDCAPQGESSLNPFTNGKLLVNGGNFGANSVARWNGNDRPTTFFGSGQVGAQITVSDIAAAGTAVVTVFNPGASGGISNALTFTITAGGVSPQSIALDPMGRFAYVANEGCGNSIFGNVSMFTITPATGVLVPVGPPVASNDEGGRFVTVDPSSEHAYVANWGEGDTAGSISTYTINSATGALTLTGTINGACPGSGCALLAPWSVAVDPSGKFAYVADEGGFAPTSVAEFVIAPTAGALTPLEKIAAGGRSISVAVDPSGMFAYVVNKSEPPGSAGNISMYTIDGGTGALASMATVTAGTDPVSIAVDRAGKFAYVTNSGSNDVSMYAINGGHLSSIGTVAAGTKPVSVAVDPAGQFAYVANSGSNNIATYRITPTTGGLSLIGMIATGLSPTSIAIGPFGKYAYVTNSGSNDVSMYSIDDVTGALTLIGTIST